MICSDCGGALRQCRDLDAYSCLGCGQMVSCRQLYNEGRLVRPDDPNPMPLWELYRSCLEVVRDRTLDAKLRGQL